MTLSYIFQIYITWNETSLSAPLLPTHMNQLFHALLAVHIIAGTIALAVAPGAMVTVKGGLWHRRWGKMYVAAMVVIALTGAVMSVLRPSLFLFIVAIFSFYLVFSGYRVLHRKRPGQSATSLDRAVTMAMILTGLVFVAYGVNQLRSSTMGLVPIVFGGIALFLAGAEMGNFGVLPPIRSGGGSRT